MTDNFEIYNIHGNYFVGKYNTEIMLVTIPILLLVLILIGYLLQNRKKQKLSMFVMFSLSLAFFTQSIYAVCPVCTVAVGAGLGFARYFNIDDLITSIWMGGLIVSSIYWILNWLAKRKIKSTKVTVLTYTIMYLLVIVPLYFVNTIGVIGNTLFGIDKVLLGIIFGSILFLLGMNLNLQLKTRNSDRVYFPFQKVVLPVLALWFGTLISYYLIYYLL